jgi:hypothetical protein
MSTPITIANVLDKHLTTVMNCLQNVVYFLLLASFVETGMFFVCYAASHVSPVDSWKGLLYNMWFGAFVLVMMVTFKNTLEFLLCFENAKRLRASIKEDSQKAGSTTTCMVDKESVSFKHVDNRPAEPNPSWTTIASFMLTKYFDELKTSTPSQAPASPHAGDDIKQEDETKPLDAASASSSASSNADTDALN